MREPMVPAPRTAARRTSERFGSDIGAGVAAVAVALMRALPFAGANVRYARLRVNAGSIRKAGGAGSRLRALPSAWRSRQYSILLGDAIQAAKLAQASSPSNCVERSLRWLAVFAELGVEKCVVKTGASCVGGAGSIIDSVEPRPVGRRKAHGAWLATGIEFAAGKREGSESFGGGADGVDFSVRGGIVGCGDGVGAFADDLAVAHDDRAKRAARRRSMTLLRGQRDGAAQKLRVGLG